MTGRLAFAVLLPLATLIAQSPPRGRGPTSTCFVRASDTPHRDEVEPLIQLVSPFAPHLAEELWEQFGHWASVFDAGWPSYDADLAREQTIELAVQVNGKLRGTVRVAPDVIQEDALAPVQASPTISRFVTGPIKKVIFVRGRLLNIVV